jgi:outer membrane receptor protein involved in Fe transport
MVDCLEQLTAVDPGGLNFRRTQAAWHRVLPGLAYLLLCALCMGTLTASAWAQWQGRDLADLSLEELSQVEVATTTSAPQDSSRTKDLTELSPEGLTKIQVATVTTASKYAQKVTEAPTSASVITADDIQRYGYRTLVDIVNSVPGFYVSNDRNYSYFGARVPGDPRTDEE